LPTVTSSVKPVADLELTCAVSSRGAEAGMESFITAGEDDARLTPLSVEKLGLIVMVPATDPVWMRTCVALLGNTARVLLAEL